METDAAYIVPNDVLRAVEETYISNDHVGATIDSEAMRAAIGEAALRLQGRDPNFLSLEDAEIVSLAYSTGHPDYLDAAAPVIYNLNTTTNGGEGCCSEDTPQGFIPHSNYSHLTDLLFTFRRTVKTEDLSSSGEASLLSLVARLEDKLSSLKHPIEMWEDPEGYWIQDGNQTIGPFSTSVGAEECAHHLHRVRERDSG